MDRNDKDENKVIVNNYSTVDLSGVYEKLNLIIKNQSLFMEKFEELKSEISGLKTQVTDLQSTVDTEQAQIAALLETNAEVVTRLNQHIATLEAQAADAITPEAVQTVIDGVKDIRDSLITTKADLAATVADEQPPAQG